jgi:glycogen(starch) synthase
MEELEFLEVSFEVANKVGGIYQVLSSKSSKMADFYGEGYLTVGYYDEASMRKEFAPRENPYDEIFEKLSDEGIECYYGAWEVEGSPRTILVDASGLEKNVDEIKEFYWEEHGIDSYSAGHDFDEPVKWGYAVARLVEELEKEQEFVVQLHEWLSSGPVFHVDSPTVFTTHATVLGRALSNSHHDLLSMIESGDIDDEGLAGELGVKAKHEMEKAAARESDVFTTVSNVTGEEASAIHGIEPDKILSNGFNVEDYPSLEDLSVNHKNEKDEVLEFLNAYFDPYYPLELGDDPRIFFTSGRYEFYNKGFDLLIEALGRINERPGEDLYFFFLVPSDVKGPDMEVLENKSLYEELEDYVESKMPELRTRFVNSVASGEDPVSAVQDCLKDSGQLEFLQENFHKKRGSEGPPISAFELNYENDDIVESLRAQGITNSEDDRVKVVFYPTYLSVGDKLLSMDYEDMVVASSAGFFPSYYEPWGYTPVETAANGALALTSDLSGFGQFLMEQVDSSERKGIQILERKDRDREEVVEELARTIEEFLSFDKTEITERKHNARKLAQLTSWEKLGENYREAHKMAVEKHD